MKRLSLFLAVILLLTLCACAAGNGTGDHLSVWLVSHENDAGPELRAVSYSGAAELPALMEALLAGSSTDPGLKSPLPERTRLLGWSINENLTRVDLSEEYNRLSGVALTIADYCIVLTLAQLESVENIRITVEGKAVAGRTNQVLSASDVVLSGAEEEPVELTAALCFRRIGGNELGEELRVFRLTENQSATLAVLQALLAGPTEPGLQALLPQDVQVYSARVEAGVCYADFSSALLTNVPANWEDQNLVIDSVVKSLQSLGHVQSVQFLLEGEPFQYYGSVNVSQPLD